MQPKTLETTAFDRVISLATSDQSTPKLDWWILPQCLGKAIESEITKTTLNGLRKDFGVVVECHTDFIVLMGRGKSRGKCRPRKAKHLHAYDEAVYWDTKWRVNYQTADDMAVIESQSLDYFSERRWLPRKLSSYYSDGSGPSKPSLKDSDSSTCGIRTISNAMS